MLKTAAIPRTQSKPLRVLQFGRFNNPEQNGGIERHMQLLCEGLVALGVDVTYLVAGDSRVSKTSTIFTPSGKYGLVEAATFGTYFSTAASPMQVIAALKMHHQNPFNIVHLHFPNPLAHLLSLLLPAEVKRVITWHSDIVKQKRLLKFYQPFLESVTSKADALIAATPAHYTASTQISNRLAAEKKHVIPYGRDYNDLTLTPQSAILFQKLKEQAKTASTSGHIVFALGRHVYYKGFDVLIEAMQHVDAQLILGGDGPLRAQLQQLAERLGLEKKIYFANTIPEADLAAYFNVCDVFCLPSVAQSEAFGLVQLEAMACGKPVVCSQLNNGVNTVNIDGVTGLAVPAGDVQALAATLTRLLNSESLRKQLGEQGRKHVQANYSLSSMSNNHFTLYKDLLKLV